MFKRILIATFLLGSASRIFAAFPTILIDATNANASDSAASGAGPTTAVTGSTVSTSVTGLVVTLSGSPDLTNVAVDGSHALFLNDLVAGKRCFAKITAKDGSLTSTASVTVSEAYAAGMSSSTAWAIGGVRRTLLSTTTASIRLIDNNAASGDAMPGWIMELQSGHVETSSQTVTIRRAGDRTSGAITIRGKSGAATMPILIFNNNGSAFTQSATGGWYFQNFEMQNSNATKTASVGFTLGTASNVGDMTLIDGIKIANSSKQFWKGILTSNGAYSIRNCDIGFTGNNAIEIGGITLGAIARNYIHQAGNHGIAVTATALDRLSLIENLIVFSAADAINIAATTGAGQSVRGPQIIGNTLHGSTSDGLEIASPMNSDTCILTWITNNIFTNNGVYGINFSGAGMSNIRASAQGTVIDGNLFNGNTSGPILTLTIDTNSTSADPSCGLTSSTKDYAGTSFGAKFSVCANAKAKGTPVGGTTFLANTSGTYTYIEPGAAQRKEPTLMAPFVQ